MYNTVHEARKDGWKIQVSHFRNSKNRELLFHSKIDRKDLLPTGGITVLVCSKNNKDIVVSYPFEDTVNYNKKVGIGECMRRVRWE